MPIMHCYSGALLITVIVLINDTLSIIIVILIDVYEAKLERDLSACREACYSCLHKEQTRIRLT